MTRVRVGNSGLKSARIRIGLDQPKPFRQVREYVCRDSSMSLYLFTPSPTWRSNSKHACTGSGTRSSVELLKPISALHFSGADVTRGDPYGAPESRVPSRGWCP